MAAKQFKPHEIAPHIAALFRMLPNIDMGPVRLAMKYATAVLLKVLPTDRDLTDPDNGIPYALTIDQGEYQKEIKAAGTLLRLCLHAIERGESTENERVFIPLQLAAIAGFVPDKAGTAASWAASWAAGHKRPKSSELDALDRGLDDALKANPDGSWTEHLYWLMNAGVVTRWQKSEALIYFTDGDNEEEKKEKTFQNRRTEAKKRRK